MGCCRKHFFSFSLISFYLHGPSRSGCWLSQYNLDQRSPVTHRVWLPPRFCPAFQSAPAGCNFLSSLFLCTRWSTPLWFSDSWETKIHQGCVFMCVWRVINGVRRVYFHFLGEKIWVFALSLPFNLSCRMERLFNSSITRKCPPEHKRSGARAGEAGEAGDLDPPTSISL